MVEKEKSKIVYLDYAITAQLVIFLLIKIFLYNKYENLMVYFSCIVFVSYWIIRICWNPELSKKLAK